MWLGAQERHIDLLKLPYKVPINSNSLDIISSAVDMCSPLVQLSRTGTGSLQKRERASAVR